MRWDREQTYELLKRIIDLSEADQTEACFMAYESGLTRFAENRIHQNMCEEDAIVVIRVAIGKKLGSVSANQFDEASLVCAIQKAIEIASLNQPNELFDGFAEKQPLAKIRSPWYISETASAGTKERADIVSRLIQKVENSAYEAAGSVSNGVYVSSVLTSVGQFVYQQETRCGGLTVVNRPGEAGFGTGYSEYFGRDINLIHPEELAAKAVHISAMNHDAKSLAPGDYPAVLTPASVGLLIFYLGWMALHARAVQSGQSFLAGHFGEEVLDPKLSIWDDALDGRNYGMNFDWEGNPTRYVDIIRNGKAIDVVYDTFTAKKAGRKSTGHALSPLRDRYYSSPMAEHLIVGTGDAPFEKMIEETERGILINHLWYVREVNFKSASVTGMTRDGTFVIENGKITHALKNLRFSVSLRDVFQSIEMIGTEQELTPVSVGTVLAPAIKLEHFNIDGSSSY